MLILRTDFSGASCAEFFDLVTEQNKLLKRIHSTDKYCIVKPDDKTIDSKGIIYFTFSVKLIYLNTLEHEKMLYFKSKFS